jgi:integrase
LFVYTLGSRYLPSGLLQSDSPKVSTIAYFRSYRISRAIVPNFEIQFRKIIVRHSEKAGIDKQMSPHRIRHSAITAALDATDGNVPKVQKLSRHKNMNTLMIYDDNRGRDQQDVTEMLDGMF